MQLSDLTSHDFILLAGRAFVTLPTTYNAYRGGRSTTSTLIRLTLAAKELGLPPPPTAGASLGRAQVTVLAAAGKL